MAMHLRTVAIHHGVDWYVDTPHWKTRLPHPCGTLWPIDRRLPRARYRSFDNPIPGCYNRGQLFEAKSSGNVDRLKRAVIACPRPEAGEGS